MIFFYVDESGTGLKDKNSQFFVLSAFALSAEHWSHLDSQIVVLKRRLISWVEPEDFEIKGRDMRRGEKFFQPLNWGARLQAMNDVAQLIAAMRCNIFAVRVNKAKLPNTIHTDDDLYRIAFRRLLDRLEAWLQEKQQPGMLMFDMRSTLHSSVQDRRLINAYRSWLGLRTNQIHLIELPWFGFSEFYTGLQMADFTAYIVDSISNEGGRSEEMQTLFKKFREQVQIIDIP